MPISPAAELMFSPVTIGGCISARSRGEVGGRCSIVKHYWSYQTQVWAVFPQHANRKRPNYSFSHGAQSLLANPMVPIPLREQRNQSQSKSFPVVQGRRRREPHPIVGKSIATRIWQSCPQAL